MAHPPTSSPSTLKRPATSLSQDPPSTKRPKVHHHYPHHRQNIPADGDLENIHIQTLLTRSLSLVLKDAGFDGAEPVAVESFRAEVEEYMRHFLAYTTTSMLASRRTQPLPQDFVHALTALNMPSSTLEPYLATLLSPNLTQPPLRPSTPPSDPHPPLSPILGPTLSGALEKSTAPYVPPHFPDFPSKHTYRATPRFEDRDRDPRRMRERATEEGRLGEEALRRLMSAGSEAERSAGDGAVGAPRRERPSKRRERLDIWAETMAKVAAKSKGTGDGGGTTALEASGVGDAARGDLSDVVNCERAYWRKTALGARRGTKPAGMGASAGATGDVSMPDVNSASL
ncbi:MAG: hypothetical protein M1817_002277 [Caeruleum heppii]|nr:MAG: hypothetical protein M1817_002277 [Caeruleum heppii]